MVRHWRRIALETHIGKVYEFFMDGRQFKSYFKALAYVVRIFKCSPERAKTYLDTLPLQ